jgi:hypothetical protein
MKIVSLCSALLCLLISCSTDSDFNASENKINTIIKSKRNLPNPENTANPFDFKGESYYDELTLYWQKNEYLNSIEEITQQIRFLSLQLKGTSTNKSIIPFTDEIVESIMADPDQSMILIVQNSTLSSASKISLINFLQSLIEKRDLEFSITYSYIVNYEDTVISDSSFSEDDKETILTVTSISRYSLFSAAERKDRDWDKSGANKNTKPFFETNQVAVISVIAMLSMLN